MTGEIAVYQPGQDGDALLLNWYATLVADGDHQKLLGPSVWSLSAFMRHFTELTAQLYYLADERGIWIAAWTFPLLGGGTWGLWVRKDKRASGSRKGLSFIMGTIKRSLSFYPVLVNTTTQPEVVAKTCRLGYTYLGMIPHLFEGQDCHVMHLTRDAFDPIYSRWSDHERRKDKSPS